MLDTCPCITGTGYAVPAAVRNNDDPVFDWLRRHHPAGNDLFLGYEQRRVLGEGEDLLTLMVPAALAALADAGLPASEVDLLLGTGSIGPYWNPNPLTGLHKQLRLPPSAWVIPLANEFSNFSAALLMADALIKAGHCRNILVCVGGNWSRNVSYRTPQAVSAGDGAGAAVVSAETRAGKWAVVAQQTLTASDYYGSMYTLGEKVPAESPQDGDLTLWTDRFFQIMPQGMEGFKAFGGGAAASAVTGLLQSRGLAGSDVTLISHQASSVLSDAWADIIRPAAYVSTLKQFANMAPANVPVTFAWSEKHAPVTTGHLVLLSLGPDMHANALLLKRTGTS